MILTIGNANIGVGICKYAKGRGLQTLLIGLPAKRNALVTNQQIGAQFVGQQAVIGIADEKIYSPFAFYPPTVLKVESRKGKKGTTTL